MEDMKPTGEGGNCRRWIFYLGGSILHCVRGLDRLGVVSLIELGCLGHCSSGLDRPCKDLRMKP